MDEIRTLTESAAGKIAAKGARFVLRNGATFIAFKWRDSVALAGVLVADAETHAAPERDATQRGFRSDVVGRHAHVAQGDPELARVIHHVPPVRISGGRFPPTSRR